MGTGSSSEWVTFAPCCCAQRDRDSTGLSPRRPSPIFLVECEEVPPLFHTPVYDGSVLTLQATNGTIRFAVGSQEQMGLFGVQSDMDPKDEETVRVTQWGPRRQSGRSKGSQENDQNLGNMRLKAPRTDMSCSTTCSAPRSPIHSPGAPKRRLLPVVMNTCLEEHETLVSLTLMQVDDTELLVGALNVGKASRVSSCATTPRVTSTPRQIPTPRTAMSAAYGSSPRSRTRNRVSPPPKLPTLPLAAALAPIGSETGTPRSAIRKSDMSRPARKKSATFSADEDTGCLRLWSTAEGFTLVQECSIAQCTSITCMAALYSFLYVGDSCGNCYLYELRLDRITCHAKIPTGSGCALLGVDVDLDFVYAVDADRHISVWSRDLCTEESRMETFDSYTSPVSKLLAVARPYRRQNFGSALSPGVHDGASDMIPVDTDVKSAPFFVSAISTDKRSGLLALMNMKEKRPDRIVQAHEHRVTSMTLGETLGIIATCGGDSFICLWDALTLDGLVRVIAGQEKVASLGWETMYGNDVFAMGSDGTLKVFRVKTMRNGGNDGSPR